MTNPNDDMLDDLFATARAAQPAPRDDLVARVLADAQSVLPAQPEAATAPRPGLWDRMLDTVGGWPAVSGLAAATVAGVWIGVAPPSSMEDLTAGFLGDEINVSLFPTDFDLDAGEFADG